MSLCIYFTEEFSNLKLELSQPSWLVMDWKQLITQEVTQEARRLL